MNVKKSRQYIYIFDITILAFNIDIYIPIKKFITLYCTITRSSVTGQIFLRELSF